MNDRPRTRRREDKGLPWLWKTLGPLLVGILGAVALYHTQTVLSGPSAVARLEERVGALVEVAGQINVNLTRVEGRIEALQSSVGAAQAELAVQSARLKSLEARYNMDNAALSRRIGILEERCLRIPGAGE